MPSCEELELLFGKSDVEWHLGGERERRDPSVQKKKEPRDRAGGLSMLFPPRARKGRRCACPALGVHGVRMAVPRARRHARNRAGGLSTCALHRRARASGAHGARMVVPRASTRDRATPLARARAHPVGARVC